MRSKVLVTIIIIVVMLTIPTIWYGYLYITYQERREVEYLYKLSIVPDSNLNYTLYLPVLDNTSSIHNTGAIDDIILKNVKCREDNASYDILETDHGKSLAVRGNSYIMLEFRFMYINGNYWLTHRRNQSRASDYYKGKYWIFCDIDSAAAGISIVINYEYGNRYRHVMGHVEGCQLRFLPEMRRDHVLR